MGPDIAILISIVAGVLVVASLLQPLASRLRLPSSVLLAGLGIALGWLATTDLIFRFLPIGQMEPAADLVVQIRAMPLTADAILYIFLPALLFHTAITIDVRRMLDDLGPILILAVVAVGVCTLFVGFALSAVTAEPLLVCLLVGAIVATTDPAAVIGIFRDVGAPRRLSVLVEGESLLNDAAAIALTTLFLAALTQGATLSAGAVVFDFLGLFLGGALFGWALAVAMLRLMVPLRGLPLAEISVTVGLAYLSFVLSERLFGVSGVVATVVAGLVTASSGRTLIGPATWAGLQTVWNQVGYWAATLVFVLAATLIPRFLEAATWSDILAVIAIAVAALAARAAVLWGLLKPLARITGQPINRPQRLVMLWGGLRGAITLALALAVTENPALPDFVRSFVAIGATGYVLFTLLVQATTLRPLMKLLNLDTLSPLDRALRARVIGLALDEVEERLAAIAGTHRLERSRADRLIAETHEKFETLREETLPTLPLNREEQVRLGLTALAVREEELYLAQYAAGTVSRRTLPFLRAKAGRLFDAAKTGGRTAYFEKAEDSLRFRARFRLGLWLHRRFGWTDLLARALTDRFETVLVTRIVLESLTAYVTEKLSPVLGDGVGAALREALSVRLVSCEEALDAMRLQYPDYAEAQERRFLRNAALRLEEGRIRQLAEEGVISQDVMRQLVADMRLLLLEGEPGRTGIDLGLGTEEMISRLELFRGLPDSELAELARVLRPVLAVPGETLIQAGERGNEMYFIAAGVVEVLVKGRRIRLGPGQFFGELALLRGRRRTATVRAMDYCRLLRLQGRDFRDFLRSHPEVRDHIRREAMERAEDRAVTPPPPTLPPSPTRRTLRAPRRFVRRG